MVDINKFHLPDKPDIPERIHRRDVSIQNLIIPLLEK